MGKPVYTETQLFLEESMSYFRKFGMGSNRVVYLLGGDRVELSTSENIELFVWELDVNLG